MSSYDYWEHHSFLHSSRTERAFVDYLLNDKKNSPYSHEIPDLSARVQLSALALLGDKEYARTGTRNAPGGLNQLYQSERWNNYLKNQLKTCRTLLESPANLSLLPQDSFSISFEFTLIAPYISKDDTALHLLDNAIKKEWVFKLPYIAGTQWKGSLRAAIRQAKGWENTNCTLLALFGRANDHDDDGKEGRLHFYPTFFDRMSLEVINPHERKSGTGTVPILIESVPTGTTGTFTLLYVPFDCIGKEEKEKRKEVLADLELIIEGIQAMLTTYGFGAKTSSGFGVAKDEVTGTFVMNYADVTQSKRPPSPPKMPEEPEALRTYRANFPNEDFTLKPDEWRKQRKATNSQRDAYKAAKADHIEYQKVRLDYDTAFARYQEELAAWETIANTPPPTQTERTFTDFTTLVNLSKEVGMLREE